MMTTNGMHFTCACMMHVFGTRAQPRKIKKTSHFTVFLESLAICQDCHGNTLTLHAWFFQSLNYPGKTCARACMPHLPRKPSLPPTPPASKAAPEKKEKAAEARHLMCVCVCDVTVQQLPSALLLTVWVFVWHVCAKKRCVCGEIAW